MNQVHRDLRKHLRNKIKLALRDHVDLCETVDLPHSDIAAGIGDILLHITIGFFIALDLTPQQFGQICHDAYREVQEDKHRESEEV